MGMTAGAEEPATSGFHDGAGVELEQPPRAVGQVEVGPRVWRISQV